MLAVSCSRTFATSLATRERVLVRACVLCPSVGRCSSAELFSAFPSVKKNVFFPKTFFSKLFFFSQNVFFLKTFFLSKLFFLRTSFFSEGFFF